MYIYVGMNMAKHFLDVKHFSRCSPSENMCILTLGKDFDTQNDFDSEKIFSPYREINSLTNAIP